MSSTWKKVAIVFGLAFMVYVIAFAVGTAIVGNVSANSLNDVVNSLEPLAAASLSMQGILLIILWVGWDYIVLPRAKTGRARERVKALKNPLCLMAGLTIFLMGL